MKNQFKHDKDLIQVCDFRRTSIVNTNNITTAVVFTILLIAVIIIPPVGAAHTKGTVMNAAVYLDYDQPMVLQNGEYGRWSERTDQAVVILPNGDLIMTGGSNWWGNEIYNDVWKSVDNGLTWKRIVVNAPWGSRAGHSMVVLKDGSILIMGGYWQSDNWEAWGDYSDVWRSTNGGKTWKIVTDSPGWEGRDGFSNAVLPDGSIILSGGETMDGIIFGDTWRSTDNGKTWIETNDGDGWAARTEHSMVISKEGSILIMGGYSYDANYDPKYYNDVWKSVDNGSTWTIVSTKPGWSKRCGHTVSVLGAGEIYLMGGRALTGDKYNNTVQLNDVWKSADNGTSWIRQSNALWEPRYNAIAIVTQSDNILVIGGYGATQFSDTWELKTRITEWNPIFHTVSWAARNKPIILTMPDNSMVLFGVGGSGSGELTSDVWKSTDKGVTWTEINPAAPWGKRCGQFATILSDGTIIMSGGEWTNTTRIADTWRSTDGGVTWTQSCVKCGWKGRYGGSMTTLPDDSIILSGGNPGASSATHHNYLNDTWISTDGGYTWVQQSANAGWSNRLGASMVSTFDGDLILTAGYGIDDASTIYTSDVWKSSDKGVTWTAQNSSIENVFPSNWYGSNMNLFALTDGRLLLVGLTPEVYTPNLWESYDKGVTWSMVKDNLDPTIQSTQMGSTILQDGSLIFAGNSFSGKVYRLVPSVQKNKNVKVKTNNGNNHKNGDGTGSTDQKRKGNHEMDRIYKIRGSW